MGYTADGYDVPDNDPNCIISDARFEQEYAAWLEEEADGEGDDGDGDGCEILDEMAELQAAMKQELREHEIAEASVYYISDAYCDRATPNEVYQVISGYMNLDDDLSTSGILVCIRKNSRDGIESIGVGFLKKIYKHMFDAIVEELDAMEHARANQSRCK